MDEGGCFVIETVQTIRRLIHVCIILRHKLPSHFRGDDIIMRRVTVGRSGIRHNGVEYATEVRPAREDIRGRNTYRKVQKLRQRKKREENLRGIERGSSGRWINLVEDVRKPQRSQRTKRRALGIFRVSISYPIPILLYSTLSTCTALK
jgi:hypothetical protein